MTFLLKHDGEINKNVNSELHQQRPLIGHDGMREEASLFQQLLNYGLDCGKDKSEVRSHVDFIFQTITVSWSPSTNTFFPQPLKDEVYFYSRFRVSSSLGAAEA